MELELTVEVLLLEDRVDTDVGSVDASDLMVLEEEGETVLVGTALIGDEGELFGAPLGSGLDEVLGDTAEAEATSDNNSTVEQIMCSLYNI